ncbi:hypothetical protein [Raoultella ornithinolytica]|uniref:hypothetical protein n=1 Tax=Raoultella ornithinolytica TaxID=54291 RepID=UPI001F1E1513|nr:hypothetical protein [Raoultella ornithinolytica]MCF1304142.1 hypothetical protein [Raoultella ornithinolytica]
MEFKDLPLKVQEIAAQCLADKISSTSGFGMGVGKTSLQKNRLGRSVKRLLSFILNIKIAATKKAENDK